MSRRRWSAAVATGVAFGVLTCAAPALASEPGPTRTSASRAGYRVVQHVIGAVNVLVQIPQATDCPTATDTHQNVGVFSDARDVYVVPDVYAVVDLGCVAGAVSDSALFATGTASQQLTVYPGDDVRLLIRESGTGLTARINDETQGTSISGHGPVRSDHAFVFGDLQPYYFDAASSYPHVLLQHPLLNGAPLATFSPTKINLKHHGATISTSDFYAGGAFALDYQSG